MSSTEQGPPDPTSTLYSASASQFATMTSPFTAERSRPINWVERLAMGRSDSSFNAIAGAVGGFASGVVSCPLDVIKTKLQAQGGFRPQGNLQASNHPVYSGMLGTAKVIWREEGIRGMYRGLGPIILGYLPTWAVWFTVYGKSKEYFSQYNGNASLILCGPSDKLIPLRLSSRGKLLVLYRRWRLVNDGDQSYLGNQDKTYVASRRYIKRSTTAMALS